MGLVMTMNRIPLKLINWYQTKISPNKHRPTCRHRPTCSNYAKEAYTRFNFFKASFLTTKRVLTCNPLFKPKYDPGPEKKNKINKKDKENSDAK